MNGKGVDGMQIGEEMLWNYFKQQSKTDVNVDILAKNAFDKFKKDLKKK